jgi:hypothetical protein
MPMPRGYSCCCCNTAGSVRKPGICQDCLRLRRHLTQVHKHKGCTVRPPDLAARLASLEARARERRPLFEGRP